MIRLNKYLANLGLASRRKIDSLIEEKKISVSGKSAYPGQLIDPEKDQILVNGKEIRKTQQLVYIILNKPKCVISTVSDELKRKTVLDLVKISERVYPVGRLDEDSEGLILLTNDGELTQKLTHPKYEVSKTYQVLVRGEVSEEQLKKLRTGVVLKEGKALPDKVKVLEKNNNTWLEIALHQGINREIRRLLGVLNLEVINLKRISLGPLQLGDLKKGEFRFLTSQEIELLKK